MPIGILPYHEIEGTTAPWVSALQGGLQGYGAMQDLQKQKLMNQNQQFLNLINQAKAQYAQPMAQAELAKAQAEPQLTLAQATYQNALAKGVPSEIALRNSQVVQTQQDAAKQNILNQYLGSKQKADIAETEARAKYYNMGGGMQAAATKEQNYYQNMVKKDNPQLSDQEAYEAANVLASGGKNLASGKPINSMSPMTEMAFNAAYKGSTTAQAMNQVITGKQAEAEYPVTQKYIDDGVTGTGYGTTVFGNSPKQIKDVLDVNNHDAQTRIAKYLAAQQLLYDRAALNLKINALPPGQRIASKIVDLSAQSINAKYPMMSAEAREKSSKILAKALTEMLDARMTIGASMAKAMGVAGNNKNQSNNDPLGIR